MWSMIEVRDCLVSMSDPVLLREDELAEAELGDWDWVC